MTTLEHILEQGTNVEKELARLAESMPTKAEEKMNSEIRSCLLWTLFCGVGATALVSSELIENVHDTFSLFWGGLGVLMTGIGTLVNGSSLKDYLKVQSMYNATEEWKNVLPKSERNLFYHFNDGFTYNPTPIEVKLGERVYPIERLEEISGIKENAMAYISDVALREVSRENYESFVEIGMTDTHVEYEKILRAKVQYELRKDEEAACIDLDIHLSKEGGHYFDTFSKSNKECSLLLSIKNGGIQSISRIFPYQQGN